MEPDQGTERGAETGYAKIVGSLPDIYRKLTF